MERKTSGAGWRLTWIPDIERLRNRVKAPSVYYILCTTTKQGYIGSAKDLWERMKYHFSNLGVNKHPNYKLQSAFNHHGADVFTWGVIETCHEEMLAEREQYWINRYPPERLFNIQLKVDRTYPIITITQDDAMRYARENGIRIPLPKRGSCWWYLVYDESRMPENVSYFDTVRVNGITCKLVLDYRQY